MSPPRATLRLQLHKGFTFADAGESVAYFAGLGISHLYLSPIMTARAGSQHGYDVVDPTRVNPELGGEEALRRLVRKLRRHAMGLIVDIVPNHMAVGNQNAWWMDVLATGRASLYAKFFDIDWSPARRDLNDKILLPILGRPYGEALQAGEIRLDRDERRAAFVIRCFEHVLPLSAGDADELAALPPAAFDARSPDGFERLHRLLERQHYRLAWWRSANDDINWRRFFDINHLAALRLEDEEVFETVHASLFRLYAEGLIDGIRADHIDGLRRPEHYCRTMRRRLRELEGERPASSPAGSAYFVVEKILGRGESLPRHWATDGTTGYDFMDEIGALLHDPAGERSLDLLWQRLGGRGGGGFAREVEHARRQSLQRSFSAPFEATVATLQEIARSDLATRDFPRAAIARGLTEILVHFPVYRIYAEVGRASASDRAFLAQAVAQATTTCLPADRWIVETLGHWLAGESIRAETDPLQALALARFQQLSAPLSAKAVEDAALYRYGRLISRSEVGFDARRFASTPAEFHREMSARTSERPHSMLATATHDHKRGEDVRARLAVLSELADEWAEAVERWIELCARLRHRIDGDLVPSTGELAILFQTIVGTWPPELTTDDRPALAAFADRLARWQKKALREAKLASQWACPNEPYESAALAFVAGLLGGRAAVLADIVRFVRRIAAAGAANSLAQVLAKLTAPGVPDLYQGSEYWDLSLVDPDNRRPVDLAARRGSLEGIAPAELASDWSDGRIKQALIARVLTVRRNMPNLFSDGAYLPIAVEGPLGDHVVAFARVQGASAAITIFCRLTARLLAEDGSLTIASTHWRDTRIALPSELRARRFSDVLTREREPFHGNELTLSCVLGVLPVAMLITDCG